MKAIELFQLNIQRVDRLLDVHRRSYPRGRPASDGEADDLLRSAVVFAVSALDAYLHMRVTQVVDEIIFKKKHVPESCSHQLESRYKEGDRTRELLKIAIASNPRKDIVRLLEKSLSVVTFQKPEQIERALKFMEVTNPWRTLDKSLISNRGRKRKGKKQSCKTFLGDLSRRRDDIVHEGDVYISKKYHGKLKPITRTSVIGSVTKLKKLVVGIEKISRV